MGSKIIVKIVLGAILGVIALIFLLNSFTVIGAGEVGVQSLFGNVRPNTLEPGFHFINPFTSIHVMNVRVLTTKADSQAASSDLQTVHTQITLNYSIKASEANRIYSTIGNNLEYLTRSIVQPAMSETFKATVAEFTAEDLINKRQAVSDTITKMLQAKLNEYGIIVQSISVTDFKFSESFDNAIEAKVTAQQAVLTQQNNLARAKVEAEQKIVQAQAEATALKLQKEAITPELIQLRQIENQSKAIDKWDGRLPNYTGGNIPFVFAQSSK